MVQHVQLSPATEEVSVRFRDRIDAGRRLATVLRRYRDPAPIVLGIPRGGVVVASEVARELSAPLDAWVVRKVNAPRNQELRLGAVAEGGVAYLDEGQMHKVDIGAAEVAPIVDRRVDEVKRRARRFHR